MTYRGRVTEEGKIELEKGDGPPVGAEVSVRVIRVGDTTGSRASNGARRRGDGLMKYAGKAKGLPRDASRNLDHYLYGRRKQ